MSKEKESNPLSRPNFSNPHEEKINLFTNILRIALSLAFYSISNLYKVFESPPVSILASLMVSFFLTKIFKDVLIPILMPRFFKVELEPYSPQWAIDFAQEKKRLEAALFPQFGNLFTDPRGICHIGSTSIINIKLSTSMIDMVVKVSCDDLPKEFFEKMKELGYFTRGPSPHGPTGEDKWFHTGKRAAKPGHGTGFNIHVVCRGAHEWADGVIGFTEYCNTFEHEKKIYEDAKQAILDAGVKDMRKYKSMKKAAVNSIKERADEWRKSSKKIN